MRFLHLADCHMDAPFCDLGQVYNKADLRRKEIKETFSKAIDMAIKKKADFIFISGDLFEHKYVDKSTIKFLFNQFNRISGMRVFITPGNHDPLIHNSYYNTFSWPENVYIFNKFEKKFIEEYNVNIWGAGFSDFYVDNCMIKYIEREEKDKINILITHATLDADIKNGRYHSIDSRYLKEIGFDYCALGHIHKPNIDRNSGLCYPGSIEPLGFDETGEHGVIFGEITKDYKEIQFINIAARQYFIHDINITGLDTIEDVIKEIENLINYKEYIEGFNKVILNGETDDFTIDVKLLEEHFCNHYFIKVIDQTYCQGTFREFEKENTLKGLFLRKMSNLISKAEPKDKDMLNKALKYGLDALSKGEVKI